jgi:hypothetical protein
MKKIQLLLAIVFLAVTAHAQYIYNDFDGNQNEPFSGWPNAPLVISNPDPSGINTSANVAEWNRSVEQYAHVYTELDGTIDFSTGEIFTLKLWSPVTCDVLIKLENKINGSVFTEVMQSVSETETWVELSFDFSGASSGLYDKIVIFFDFAATNNNTFYFDDVEGPEYVIGGTGNQVTLPVTFDDPEVNYDLSDFGGTFSEIVVDPTNPDNMVAKTLKTDAAEPWAGTTVGGAAGFPTPIPFVPGSTTMKVAIWSPTAGTPVLLKVEASFDPDIFVETLTNTNVAGEWEILTFDFMNEAPGTPPINFDNTYNKASIFFNFGTPGSVAGEQTYYWDDMEFGGENPEKPLLAIDVQDNFENDGWGTIDTWRFQDPNFGELTIVADPLDATNQVANYTRSGSFEWTNAQFILEHRMDLTIRNMFQIRVLFPSTNNYTGDLTPTAAIKLQNSLLGGNAWSTQTEVVNTADILDEWVTLEFDFSIVADRTDYDQVVVQLGGEGHYVPGQFYFDDIELLNPVGISSHNISRLEISPNPATSQIRLTHFENIRSISIYSITGQQVKQFDHVGQFIDISDLTNGFYTIKAIDADGEMMTNKLIKN